MKRQMAQIGAASAIGVGILLLLAVIFSIPLPNQQSKLVVDIPPGAGNALTNLQYDQLVEQVAPVSGTTIRVSWGDMGQKLVETGAIDMDKMRSLYGTLNAEQLAILQGDDLEQITFTPENIQFWTNVLWSLGLTQESKVLTEGPMKQREAEVPLGNYASTGGWTLGSKPATDLYNSTRLIHLTEKQDAMVYRVAENIYRPCCGNNTAYPDCNHGMAVLGLLELMASQGAAETELYQAAFVFNSYAFMESYVTLAAYFAQAGFAWSEVDPQTVLGFEYSSGLAAQQIAARVGNIPDAPGQGGSCSA
jgi:hypothetical protein